MSAQPKCPECNRRAQHALTCSKRGFAALSVSGYKINSTADANAEPRVARACKLSRAEQWTLTAALDKRIEFCRDAVKRHMAGESVAVLAKYYKISKPGFYLWVAKYKQALLESADRKALTPADAALTDKRVLIAEIQALKLENAKLRNKVVSLMVKHGEL